MKYILKFREGSTQDFEDGISYYQKISINLANRFYQEFKKRIDEIEENVIHIIKILHQKRVCK